ncbi:hypothetical protein CK203_075494 [Vitis vinifera]|uniref:UBN2 domain-containing protein n=1 Tax=Vitis vinifera TaxID=29760 RepID=A0A438EU42_VITVI|nr:hypothetical protein CK203_075494 [Vitis vinifera]
MTWFLQSTDLDVWDVIEDDPIFPSKLVDGVMVLKPKQEWDERDRRNFHLGKDLQGIRKDGEVLEVTSIKVAYKGHCNSRTKYLTKLPLEELIGSLMTYEINLEKKQQEGEDKKKKSLALKATTKEEEKLKKKNKVKKMKI